MLPAFSYNLNAIVTPGLTDVLRCMYTLYELTHYPTPATPPSTQFTPVLCTLPPLYQPAATVGGRPALAAGKTDGAVTLGLPGGTSVPLQLPAGITVLRHLPGGMHADDEDDEQGAGAGQADDVLLAAGASGITGFAPAANAVTVSLESSVGVAAAVVAYPPMADDLLIIGGSSGGATVYNTQGEEEAFVPTPAEVTAAGIQANANTPQRGPVVLGCASGELLWWDGFSVTGRAREPQGIAHIAGIDESSVAVATVAGTVALYDGPTRAWTIRAKHTVTALASFDAMSQGRPAVIVGWSNGSVEARDAEDGSVLHREHCGDAVAGLHVADFRGDGRPTLTIITASGQVRALLPAPPAVPTGSAAASDAQSVDQLAAAKAALMRQVASVEASIAGLNEMLQASARRSTAGAASSDAAFHATRLATEASTSATTASVRADLQLVQQAGMAEASPAQGAGPVSWSSASSPTAASRQSLLQLAVSASGGALISGVSVFDFDKGMPSGSEAVAAVPPRPQPLVRLPLQLGSGEPATLRVQVCTVPRAGAAAGRAVDLSVKVPAFASWAYRGKSKDSIGAAVPSGSVAFVCSERPAKLGEWAAAAFIIPGSTGTHIGASTQECAMWFRHAHRQSEAGLGVVMAPLAGSAGQYTVTVHSDDVAVASQVVQDMAKSWGLKDVASKLVCTHFAQALEEACEHVAQGTAQRSALTANAAVTAERVKSAVLAMEDARALGDAGRAITALGVLRRENGALLGDATVAANNHAALLAGLKTIHASIAAAAACRVGKPAAAVVTRARACVKSKQWAALAHTLQEGP